MKKLVTLLLALLLSLSLTVPALAAGFITLGDETLSGPDPKTYEDKVVITGNVTVENGARITFKDAISVNGVGFLTIQSGATVTMNRDMTIDGKVTVGGKLKGKGGLDIVKGNISLLPGGEIDIVLDYKDQANELVSKLLENGEEKVSVNKEQTKDGCYHVTAHGHDFVNGVCTICDHECKHETKTNGVCDSCGLCLHEAWTEGVCDHCGYSCPHEAWTEDGHCAVCGISAPSGFTLSQGNLWIILAVAVAAVAAVIVLVIHKKKKN